MFLTRTGAVLKLHHSGGHDVVSILLEGAAVPSTPDGLEPVPGRVNYLIGCDPAKWVRNLPRYARVRYDQVYPGVDLVCYGRDGRFEYDFIVGPGADPGAIRLKIEGADRVDIDKDGRLVLALPGGWLIHRAPVVYQETDQGRRQLPGRFVLLADNRFGFAVDDYNPDLPLVIDPILDYSTYLGGRSDEAGLAVAVDSQGRAVAAGRTTSADFPATAGVLQGDLVDGASDAFVARLNADGTGLDFATYLGGQEADQAVAAAVDGNDMICVAGDTASDDFPMVNH